MKVIQINSVCGFGSTGKIAVDLYKALQKKNHECCIAYGRGNAPMEIQTIKIGNRADFYFHALATRCFDWHGFESKRATEKFIEQIKIYDPDIIHLHNIHGYYINVEILFKYLKEADKPVIWTLHDCWSFTGHCAHFEPIGCEKWKDKCAFCQLKRDYPQSLLFDSSNRNYNRKKNAFLGVNKMTIVTPSKWLAEKVNHSFLKDYRVEIIPNGIDIKIFHSMEKEQIFHEKKVLSVKYGVNFSKKIFLGVASVWTKDKGFDDFIKIAQMNLEDVQIVLVGITRKQKKVLPSNVIGIERTEDQRELAILYACADVFLNPTYADTFPTVNIEAMACGLPVITYRTGGSVEIASGVVEKGNWTKLAYLAKQYVGKKNVIRNSNQFDREVSINKYVHLLENQL